MDRDKEIREIISRLCDRKGFREINKEKLLAILRESELAVPEEFLQRAVDPLVKVTSSRVAPERRWTPPLFLKWSLAPALIAVAVLAFLLVRPDFFSPGSGAVYATKGEVFILRNGEKLQPSNGFRVRNGDAITTSAGSHVDVSYGRGLHIRLLAKSSCVLNEGDSGNGDRAFSALLSSGGAILHIDKLFFNDTIQVQTPSSLATVRGTIFSIRILNDRTERYEVYEGKVKIRKRLSATQGSLPEDILIQLEEHFDENAVIAGESDACIIRPTAIDLKGPMALGIGSSISDISLPKVSPMTGSHGSMIAEVTNFIDESQGIKSSPGRMGVVISLIPRDAYITIDGIRRFPVNEIIFLTAGDHFVEVSADGYQTLKKKIDISSDSRSMSFKLKKIISDATARTASRPLYLLYDNNNNSLLKVSSTTVECIRSKKTLWAIDHGFAQVFQPLLSGGLLYVTGNGDTLSAIDIGVGKIVWRRKLQDSIDGKIRIVPNAGGFYLVTKGGTLYNISSAGRIIWKAQFGENISTSPATSMQLVFIGTETGNFFAVDRQSGVKVIKVNFNEKISTVTLHNEIVYVSTVHGTIYAYNYRNDDVLWKRNMDDPVVVDMVVDGESIYAFGLSGRIIKFHASGDVLWRIDIGNKITRLPSSDGENFYIPAEKTLYVIDKKNGDVKWSLLVPGMTTRNMVLTKEKMYYMTEKEGLTGLKKR